MCKRASIAVSALLCAATASAQINVLATGSGTSSDATYTTNELSNFVPPTNTTKLVVTVNDEGSASSATYNGSAMSKVLGNIGGRNVTFFYLDYETTPTGGDLVLSGASETAVAIYALQGTAKGYCAKASTSSGTSIDFDAVFDGSFVAVALSYDGTAGTGQVVPPLIPMIEDTTMNSASFVSGYTNNVSSGTKTYSFVNTANGSIGAIAFAAAGADNIDPVLVSTSATDDGGNPTNSLTTDPILSLTFDEPVFPGSGSILLMESGGATSQTYNVTNDTRISFGVETITITPDVLTPDTSYFLRIPDGALEDGSGNSTNYPDSALTFTTCPFLTVAISNGKTTYTTNDTRGFDPTGYDKLVVCAMAESSVPSTMSWGTSNLTFIAGYRDFQMASMWFIDGPFTGPESFSVNNASVGLSFVALKGTAPGVAAFDSVSSSSNNFTTTSANSFVVAGYNINGNSPPTAAAPLKTYFSRLTASGSSSGASGVMSNSTEGAQTFSFIGESSPVLVIAEFVVGSDVKPPSISSVSGIDDAGSPTNSLLTDAILRIDFSELIYPVAGSILLRKSEDDSIVESYDVTNSTKLAFSAGRLTITPNVLEPLTSYYVEIPSGAIEDASSNTTNYPNAMSLTTGPWLSVGVQGGDYSSSALRGFDPSGYDKLVVMSMDEGTMPSSMAWGSSNMTVVVQSVEGAQRSSMWYLDGPLTGPESISSDRTAPGLIVLALQGVDPGVVAFTNASGTTVDLTTTSDKSYVVAGCQANGGNPQPLAPLETYCRRSNGAEQMGAGVVTNLIEGTQTYSFGAVGAIVIAEFQITPPPAGTVLIIR